MRTTTKDGKNTADILLQEIRSNPYISLNELAESAGITKDGVRYHLNKMKTHGILVRKGSTRNGFWEILL